MSNSRNRRKHPEAVRREVLAETARLLLEKGPAGVTLDAVSQAAGVSKGGLLHHFPNKLALLDGLFDDLAHRFDQALAERMVADPVEKGRFTRAYIAVCFPAGGVAEGEEGWKALTVAMISEPHLRERLRSWVDGRAEARAEAPLDALLVRYAVDGIWLSDLLGAPSMTPAQRAAMMERLIALSPS